MPITESDIIPRRDPSIPEGVAPTVYESRYIAVFAKDGWTPDTTMAYAEYEAMFIGEFYEVAPDTYGSAILRLVGKRIHTGYNGNVCCTTTNVSLLP